LKELLRHRSRWHHNAWLRPYNHRIRLLTLWGVLGVLSATRKVTRWQHVFPKMLEEYAGAYVNKLCIIWAPRANSWQAKKPDITGRPSSKWRGLPTTLLHFFCPCTDQFIRFTFITRSVMSP
jgi:hypothetical protein